MGKKEKEIWYNAAGNFLFIPSDENKWDYIFLLGVGYCWFKIGVL